MYTLIIISKCFFFSETQVDKYLVEYFEQTFLLSRTSRGCGKVW